MVKYVDIRVKGSLDNLRDHMSDVLGQGRVKITWKNDKKGKVEYAERGGGWRGWFRRNMPEYDDRPRSLDFEISAISEGWNLRLFNPSHQIANPFGIFNNRVKFVEKGFEHIIETLASRFSNNGLLIEVVRTKHKISFLGRIRSCWSSRGKSNLHDVHGAIVERDV